MTYFKEHGGSVFVVQRALEQDVLCVVNGPCAFRPDAVAVAITTGVAEQVRVSVSGVCRHVRSALGAEDGDIPALARFKPVDGEVWRERQRPPAYPCADL